jgi:hypothetical protein
MTATVPRPSARSGDVAALRRARRWRDLVLPLLVGAAVGAFTLGALSRRVTDRDDVLPDPAEAALIGIAFALAATPRRWAIVARAAIPVPTFFLYLSVFLGKSPPLAYGGAFAAACCYALFLTALSTYFAERPRPLRVDGARPPRRAAGQA